MQNQWSRDSNKTENVIFIQLTPVNVARNVLRKVTRKLYHFYQFLFTARLAWLAWLPLEVVKNSFFDVETWNLYEEAPLVISLEVIIILKNTSGMLGEYETLIRFTALFISLFWDVSE